MNWLFLSRAIKHSPNEVTLPPETTPCQADKELLERIRSLEAKQAVVKERVEAKREKWNLEQ